MDDPTLLIVWLFTWIAVSVMTTRLLLTRLMKRSIFLGDYLTIGAIFCAITRLALIHVVLIWGSNNMAPQFRKTHHFTNNELYHREIGSKLTIINRVFYNSYLWLQKSVLLDFYRHLIHHQSWENATMVIYVFVFAASYVGVQVVTLTECNPFDHYWRVLPDPGSCSKAQVQLITLGVLNILTDFMLLLMPIPILMKLRCSSWQKFQLYFLFSLGLFIVAVTIIRLPQNASHSTAQVNRTTWASAELLTAAFVANAPALYSLSKPNEDTPDPPNLQSDDSKWPLKTGTRDYELESRSCRNVDEQDEIVRGRRLAAQKLKVEPPFDDAQ